MADRYRTILMFGAPGVGKGTQGTLLGAIPGFFHLATGDIFRSLDAESDLGMEFLRYSTKGLLVPDDLTMRIWQQYVEDLVGSSHYTPARDLLVLDGMPRTIVQVDAIADLAEVMGIIHLVAPDIDKMVQRMKRRAEKQNRSDDADEAVIRKRFEVYAAETEPVLARFDQGLIHEIGAVGLPAEVLLKILSIVAPLYREHFGNPLDG